jgi:hypothetical protein
MKQKRIQFDLFEAERRRDDGIGLTTDNNLDWMARAILLVRLYAPAGEFMAEIFRTLPGIGTPESPNAWGALTRTAVRLKIIRHTGRYAKSSSVLNHAHEYKVYRRCDDRTP